MITLRPSSQRGQADFGWLDSRHSFSFGNYYDTRHMGFGALRVINQDRVTAGAGFGAHGHRKMEIISYVVEGALAHRDSTGTGSVIKPGDVQLMSAGRGIRHSEINGSQTEGVHFLQIWIQPDRLNTEPGYAERHFAPNEGLTLLVSPDGRDGSLPMKQDADLHRAILPAAGTARLDLRHDRAWVQVVHGELDVNGARLRAGDGAALDEVSALDLVAHAQSEALIFDLA